MPENVKSWAASHMGWIVSCLSILIVSFGAYVDIKTDIASIQTKQEYGSNYNKKFDKLQEDVNDIKVSIGVLKTYIQRSKDIKSQ